MNAFFTGTFDPLTIGHVDLIVRASCLFDKVYVYVNNNSAKTCMFTEDERYMMLNELFPVPDNIVVVPREYINRPTTDVMDLYDINVLIRGVRNSRDAEYEMELFNQYKRLKPNIEEIILPANKLINDISSTLIRECIKYGKIDKIDGWVPGNVFRMINKKFG